jgi:hypothetical protein
MECICIHHNHAFCDQLCIQLKMHCRFQRRSRRQRGDQKGTGMLRLYAVYADRTALERRDGITCLERDFRSKSTAQQYTVNRSFVPG